MFLNILVTVCISGFVGLVVLGHIILLTDFWHFRRAVKPAAPVEPGVTHAQVPAE